jgi:predicted AAA+ superfamily ATPase
MRSLQFARILSLIYPTTATEVPFPPDRKKSPRLQFLDTGLVNYSIGMQHTLLGIEDLTSEYQGHIIQHLTTQELIARHNLSSYEPNFWVRQETGSQAEVDLVYPLENLLIPIEVKSGKSGRLRSLHQYIDQCPHNFAIRLYGGEFLLQSVKTIKGKSFYLLNLPYYLAGRIPEYTEWLVGGGEGAAI